MRLLSGIPSVRRRVRTLPLPLPFPDGTGAPGRWSAWHEEWPTREVAYPSAPMCSSTSGSSVVTRSVSGAPSASEVPVSGATSAAGGPGRRRAVGGAAEPGAQRVRRERQSALGQVQRGRVPHRVGGAAAGCGVQGLGELPGGAHRGEVLRGPVVAAAGRFPRGPAGGGGVREPLVLGVGDDRGAVVEPDLVAGAVRHGLGGGGDAGGAAVRVQQPLPDLHLAHRRPPGGGGEGGVQREGLAHGRAGGDDDHLAGMQAVGERVEIGEAGGDAGHLAAARSRWPRSRRGRLP